ncbi:YjfK family protein [Caulobacter sp. B11]|nr:YjfK family protein [Caulobacter sp. B11]
MATACRDRRLYQTSMLFARDCRGDGRELLLAIEQETEDHECRSRS